MHQMFGVHSARELIQLLPGLREEERDSTLLLGPRWDRKRFCRKVRQANGLVCGNDGTVIAGSQWLDFRGRMTEEHREADARDAARYVSGDRSDEGDRRLILERARRLRESGLREDDIYQMATRQSPRPGVRSLFASFPEQNTAIVSYGLADYPLAWARAHGVPVGKVYALRLTWREKGDALVLHGWDERTLVTEATKGDARDRFRRTRDVDEQDVLVIEDTPSMLARMRHPENLAVLIIPRHDPQPGRTAERLRQLGEAGRFEDIDAFLVSDGFDLLLAAREGQL